MLALATTSARAQDLLDLDKPETPDVGERAAPLVLAETLEAQAALLDGSADASAAARGGLRRLAAALLREGHAAGDAGAVRLLAGRTLVNNLDELDEIAGGAWPDDVERLLVLGDLSRVIGRLPADDDGLDRALRDALWRLGERAPTPPTGLGWAEPAITSADDADAGAEAARAAAERVRTLGVDAETMAGVDRLLDLADEAASRRAFGASAARVRALLVGAVSALDDPPRWISEDRPAAGARDIALAAGAVLDPRRRDEGRDRLARYAALGDLIVRADMLDRGNDVRAFRERLSGFVGDLPPAPTLEALSRAMDVLDAIASGERDEKTLVRRLRPAWRWSRRSGVLAARALTERLASIADTPEPLTDPGVLSDLAAARAPLELGLALIGLSDRLDQDPSGPADRPETGGDSERIAARVLRASADLDDAESGGAARALIQRIADDLARADARASGGEPRLARAAKDARETVYAAWGADDKNDAGDPDAARASVERIERVERWLHDAEAVRRVGEGGSLAQAWAGFELAPEAADALRGGVDEHPPRLLAWMETADYDRVDDLLDRMDKGHAPVALVGAIERRLRAMSGFDGADASWSVLAQVGAGPPDASGAWLVEQRARLAGLCARAEELAAASIRDDRPAANDLRDALNTTAESLLRAVEGR